MKTAAVIGCERIETLFLNYTPHGLIIKHWNTISETFRTLGGSVPKSLCAGLKAGVVAMEAEKPGDECASMRPGPRSPP